MNWPCTGFPADLPYWIMPKCPGDFKQVSPHHRVFGLRKTSCSEFFTEAGALRITPLCFKKTCSAPLNINGCWPLLILETTLKSCHVSYWNWGFATIKSPREKFFAIFKKKRLSCRNREWGIFPNKVPEFSISCACCDFLRVEICYCKGLFP